jgi:hypothetical protein
MWGSWSIAPPFLTSALDGDEWSASCPCRFTPGERAPGTFLIGWDPQPVWTLWKREKSLSLGGNRTPAVQPVAIPTELSRPIGSSKCRLLFLSIIFCTCTTLALWIGILQYLSRFNDYATVWTVDESWLVCRQGKEISLLSTASTEIVNPPPLPQIPIHRLPRVKRLEREADHYLMSRRAMVALPHTPSWLTA